MGRGIHEKLFIAVCNGDVEKVRGMLYGGADVNFPVKDWCGQSTFLHYASTFDMVKELLFYGADVNARDYNGRTPLQNAVSQRKSLAIVRELLMNGADPNARNFQGTTALTPAIINKNFEIIKELLEYGADINIRTTLPLLRYPTPLAIAVSAYEDCAKLLIKITLIKNFDSGYKKVINLELYTECNNYNKLFNYLNECFHEIVQMKTDKANDNLTLYNFVLKKTESVKSLYERYKILDEQISSEYPIYHDVIFNKINLFLKREWLLDKLRALQIHVFKDSYNKHVKEKVVVNSDCLCKLAEYLCNDDLCTFINAFD